MKTIRKQISLNEFKSYVPSVVNAYDDGYLVDFQEKEWGLLPYVNHNMVPRNIVINNVGYSFAEVMSWYHFLDKYYNSLILDGCKIKEYNNLVELVNDNPNSSQNALAEAEVDDQKVVELNELANAIGYSTMWEFLTTEIIPSFVIPSEEREKWNCRYLFLPDVQKWSAWYLSHKEWYDEHKDQVLTDLCECELMHELIKRINVCSQLQAWLDNLSFEHIKYWDDDETDVLCSIPVLLTTNFENVGEYSLLSSDWDPQEDYQSSSTGKGTSVIYDYEVYKFKNEDDKPSYITNEYKIAEFNEEAWELSEAYEVLDSGVSEMYTYKDNKLVYSPTPRIMSQTYQIDTNNGLHYLLVDGHLYPIIRTPYVLTQTGEYLAVYYPEYDKSNPYVMYKGRKIYGQYKVESDENGNVSAYYEFAGVKMSDAIDFIDLNGTLMPTNNRYFNNHRPIKVYGYFMHNNKQRFIGYNEEGDGPYEIINAKGSPLSMFYGGRYDGTETELDETLPIKGYYIENDVVYLMSLYDIYDSFVISGEGESKLTSLLPLSDRVYDNMGEMLPGTFPQGEIPKEGDYLDLVYKPGLVAHLSQYGDEKYLGDIIEKMTFYYLNYDSQPVISFEWGIASNDDMSSTDIIRECMRQKDDYIIAHTDLFFDAPLRCDIKYRSACVLNTDLTIDDNNDFKGITYVDKFILELKECYFNVDNKHCYSIYYYDLVGATKEYENSDYHVTQEVNLTTFSFKRLFKLNENNKFQVKLNDEGYINSPVYFNEYNLGVTAPEKIQTNIYINRGTAKAFDSHLKLQEVKTMEALENYGNAWFNII